MANSKFASEIKASMAKKSEKEPGPGDNPKEMAVDKKRGIPEGSPRDEKLDVASVHPSAHPVVAAAGIAHAILGHRGGM